MQIQRIGWKVKGLYGVADYALRWGMVNQEAEKRYRILEFWDKHGLEATRDAFQVSRRTLFHWKARFHAEASHMAALGMKNRAPNRR